MEGGYYRACHKENGITYDLVITRGYYDVECQLLNLNETTMKFGCGKGEWGSYHNGWNGCQAACIIYQLKYNYYNEIYTSGEESENDNIDIKGPLIESFGGYAHHRWISQSYPGLFPKFNNRVDVGTNPCPPAIITSTTPTNGSTSTSKISTITINTDIAATCKYSTIPNLNFDAMTPFTTTNSASHSFTFNGDDNTNYNFYFKCIDEFGDVNQADYYIRVLVNYNNPPTINSTPIIHRNELDPYSYQVTATDSDNDSLTYSDNTTLFDINPTTGLISFIPEFAGNYTIKITASDGTAQAEQTYTLAIGQINNLFLSIISPDKDSYINDNSVLIKAHTNKYAQCNYSLDTFPFKKFNISNSGYWQLATSNHLELSEDLLAGGTNKEVIRNITTYIDKSNLDALASSSVTNNKATSPYNQYLYLLGPGAESALDTGYVIYTENDDDTTSDFLYFKSGKEIGRYLLEFTTPFESGIYDNNSNPSQLGLNLKDFKNVTLKVLGKNYKIIEAKRTSPNGNGIKLIFTNETADSSIKNTFFVKDTLLEQQTKPYTIKDKNYSITLNFVDSDEAQFIINNQATGKLKIDSRQDLTDNLIIEVNDILYQDFAGGIHKATFSISAEEITTTQKFELRDDNVGDYISTSALKVNDDIIDNAKVIIEGSDDGITFKINRLHLNMTADDNFFVPAGGKLSEAIKTAGGASAEPQVLFTENWDIAYNGLKNENTEKIKLENSGTSLYNLEFVDADGNKVSVPIAKSPGGSNLIFGDTNKDFVNVEAWNINKDDYLVITNGTAIRGSRPTYILQYKGADKITTAGHVLRFKNLGNGETLQVNYTNSTPLAYLNLIGAKNDIYLATSADINQNDFNIQVDLNSDGILSNDITSNIITTRYGAEINITNQSSSDSILMSIRTPDDDTDNGINITNIETIEAIINVTNGSANTTINTKEKIKVYTQGNSTYYLEFNDGDRHKVNLPIAENGTNNTIFFGQINKSLINKETYIIKKDYYFVVSSVLEGRWKKRTYALQYLGADRVTANSPVLSFKNLGSGDIFQQSYSDGSQLVTLKLGGQDFIVFKAPSADVSTDDFDIQIDLDASGSLNSDSAYIIPITTNNGVEINITNNTSPNTVQLIIRTFDTIINQTIKAKDNVDNLYPTILRINISASDGNVQHKIFSTMTNIYSEPRLNFRTPDGQTNVEYAYTSYGTFIKREYPSGQPATLEIDYPEKQREPLVYYESGGDHSALLNNLTDGQHTIRIKCYDLFGKLTTRQVDFNARLPLNVTYYWPANGSNNINIASSIIFAFDKNIDTSTLNKENIALLDSKRNKINGKIFYDIGSKKITLDPNLFLSPNETYAASISTAIKSIDGSRLSSDFTWKFTTGLKDTDNDGIPDDEDSDKDNDGIDDSSDFFRGNLSNINSNFGNLSFMIDSDFNVSKQFNGTKKLEFRIGENKLLEFDFNFSPNSIFDFSNLSILNASNSSLGGVIIKGMDLSMFGFKKTAFVERTDSSKNGLCIKDEEIDWIDNITDSCTGSNEFKIECDGSLQKGYTCTYNSTSNMYKVTGLSHSGVVQLAYTQPSSGGSSESSSGGGSGGGGGGGSGGSGGGGGIGYVCNMEWECGEWSQCTNGYQTRECNFIKVAQHVQKEPCEEQSKIPETSKKCEAKQAASTSSISKSITKENQKPAQNISNTNSTNNNQNSITGRAIGVFSDGFTSKLAISLIAIIAVAGLVYSLWHKKK